eukprot:2274036-Prymnesium_polylepis.1
MSIVADTSVSTRSSASHALSIVTAVVTRSAAMAGGALCSLRLSIDKHPAHGTRGVSPHR